MCYPEICCDIASQNTKQTYIFKGFYLEFSYRTIMFSQYYREIVLAIFSKTLSADFPYTPTFILTFYLKVVLVQQVSMRLVLFKSGTGTTSKCAARLTDHSI